MELAVFFNAGDFVWKIAIAYNFYTTQKKNFWEYMRNTVNGILIKT